MADPAPAPLDALAAEMMQVEPVSGVVVRKASAEWGVGSDGGPVVRLALVLDDPADGVAWDPDVLLGLQTIALSHAARHGIREFVYVDLMSQTESTSDDDDEDEPGLGDLGPDLEEEFPEDGDRPSDSQR